MNQTGTEFVDNLWENPSPVKEYRITARCQAVDFWALPEFWTFT